MKKLKYILFYALYPLAKYGPRSSSRFPTKGKLRSYFDSKLMMHCGKGVNVERGATFSRRLSVGDHSGIGVNAQLQGTVTIGNHVMMGPECYVYTTNHAYDRLDVPICEQGNSEEKPVVIEDDVWIGSRVTILPGVTVGHGSVIGTGSVVTKDVLPFSVIGGVPAKLLKRRGNA